MQAIPAAQQPLPPILPSMATPCSHMTELVQRPSTEKIKKRGVKKFRGKTDDDPTRVEY